MAGSTEFASEEMEKDKDNRQKAPAGAAPL